MGVHTAMTLAVGAQGWWLVSVLCTHVAVRMVVVHQGQSARRSAEEHIAIVKTLKPIVAVNEAVLYTLIPLDVALRVSQSAHKGTSRQLVAAPIGAVSILFCNVEGLGGGSPEQEFGTLSRLFLLLDDAVRKSGFFKCECVREPARERARELESACVRVGTCAYVCVCVCVLCVYCVCVCMSACVCVCVCV